LHVISRKRLRDFAAGHADAEGPLETWYQVAKHAQWQSLVDVRSVYSHADLVGCCTVFNIGGRKYRLVAIINYGTQVVYVRHVLTHAEYDKERWKDECGC
jgi:mRNA interferase HigB